MDFGRMRKRMVSDQIERRGVEDEDVLTAMRRIPREAFVLPEYKADAYEDSPLPIGYEQTISQPFVVARMIELLGVRPSDRALEVGSGSGYAAAVLGELAHEVHAVELIEPLAQRSRAALRKLGAKNVHVHHGDGTWGWPEDAPYDVILVSACAPEIPESLLVQLAPGGRMIIPVEQSLGAQRLVRVRRVSDDEFDREPLELVRFVPLVSGQNERHLN